MTLTVRAAGFLLSALCAVPLAAQEAPRHLLRLSFVPGKVQYYRQSMTMQSKMKMGERTMDTGMDMGMTMRSEVLEVEGGKAKVRNTFERVTAKMDNPMMKVDYDSDDPESRAGALAVLEEMVGESILMQIDNRAHVSGVELSDGFPESAIQMLGGDMERFLSQSVPEMPDEPIAVGETWQTTMPMAMGQLGEAEIRVTNKLLEVAGGLARIEQQMAIDTGKMQLPGGGNVKFGKAQGYTVIDLATGVPVDAEVEMNSKVEGGQMAMEMVMRVKVTAEAPRTKDAAGAKSDGDGDGDGK